MRILVADDNPDNIELVTDIIEILGHDILTANDGPSALSVAQNEIPDLIVLDVNMPGMSGFEVCSTLKADKKTASIPILMLTALGDIGNRVEGLGLGADDYLTKPFSARELMARIETRLRAKATTDNLVETQEILRDTFERFVSPSVVEQLLADPSQVQLGGRLQEITVLFADLEGFTSISERIEPERLLGVLNDYHTLIVRVIQEHGGTVDKFMGDAVMALYNTPVEQIDHAQRAVHSALKIQKELRKFSAQLEPEFGMPVNFGIHTGQAVVGNVGTPDIMDFTAVGDTVNIASRLQGLANSGQILVSEAVYEKLSGLVGGRAIGLLTVKGRSKAVMTYDISDQDITESPEA